MRWLKRLPTALTGAIVVALGEVYAGLFGSDDEWTALIRDAGEESGDLHGAALARALRERYPQPDPADDSPDAQIIRLFPGVQVTIALDASNNLKFQLEFESDVSTTRDLNVDLASLPGISDAFETGEPVLKVVQGGTASIKVLPYFRDPEGNRVMLVQQ